MNRPELLAPAGDYDCFLAAIYAGADAVYLGGRFSARAYAKNFTEEEIIKAINYAHLYSRKVYMTLNTVMKEDELNLIGDYLDPFYRVGLDGVIVQDIGLISYIKEYFPGLDIHASTQMTITDLEGVKLMKELGITRVVPARELSLEEIRYIHDNTDTELECFIHGALCYSYSGKCLMSSMLGGRSGNRGRCAQPCRLPYDGEYLCSLKDICTIDILPKLIDAGIASFKIEGRMKSPDYVAGVTGIYRKYIDIYCNNPGQEVKVSNDDKSLLLKLYTRSGNSEGYYFKKNGRDMVTLLKPGYEKAEEEVRESAYKRFTDNHFKLKVNMTVNIYKNSMAELTLSYGDKSVSVTGAEVMPAIKRPLSEDDIKKQLSKTGDLEFEISELNINADNDIFMPVSSLNELRREGFKALREAILKPYYREHTKESDSWLNRDDNFESDTDIFEISDSKGLDGFDKFSINASCISAEQLRCLLKMSCISEITVPYRIYRDNRDYIKSAVDNKKIYIRLPYVIRNKWLKKHEKELDECLLSNEVAGVMTANYEGLEYCKKKGLKKEIISDLHLYALNRRAVCMYKKLGVNRITVPIELNKKELLRRGIIGEEIIVYGRFPLMVSAQCIKKTKSGCAGCEGFVYIEDRYHVSFPDFHECENCTNILYNSVPISLHKDLDMVSRLRAKSIRLDFSVESGDETEKVVALFNDLLTDPLFPNKPDYEFTRGHLNRGVE